MLTSERLGLTWNLYLADPQQFWKIVYQEVLKREVVVPSVPFIRPETRQACERFGWLLVWLDPAALRESPEGFWEIWKQAGPAVDLVASEQLVPASNGLWVVTENLHKPDQVRTDFYRHDPLSKALGLTTRFHVLYDRIHDDVCPQVAELLCVNRNQVKIPQIWQWLLLANLFSVLTDRFELNLPDLLHSDSWEYVLDRSEYCPDNPLVIGYCDNFGDSQTQLSFDTDRRRGREDYTFRLLAEL